MVGGVVSCRIAGAPIEGLPGRSWRLDADETRLGGDDDEGVGDAFGHEGHAAAANPAALAVGLHFDLAVDDVGHLVGFGMKMQRCRLVLHHGVLEQEEGAAGVLGEQLPDVEPAAREQLLVSFVGVAHDRDQLLHLNTTLLVRGTSVP